MKLKQLLHHKLKRNPRAKTPTVLQMEAVECGAAVLGIILSYYGSYVPLEELRIACGVSRDGSKANNMLKAARKYGLTAKGFRKEPADLRDITLPAIIHWNFNHFVVLEGFHRGKVYINDPATGPQVITEQELDEAFTGVVLIFERSDDYRPIGQKPSLLKALRQRTQNSELALALIVLASLALVIPGLLLPAFTRVFVDQVLLANQSNWVGPLLLGMVLTAAVRMALTWLQQRYLLRLELKLALTSASELYWHILRLPMAFFTQRSAGDVSARIDQNDRVARLLSAELATTLLNVILLVFYVLLMLQYSVPLTLFGIGMAVVNFIALRLVSRTRIDINRRLVKADGKLMGTTFSTLQQIETLKASGGENAAFSRWAGYLAKSVSATQKLGVATQLLNVVPYFLTQFTNVVVLVAGGFLVVDGQMTLGMLVAFQSLILSFLAPVTQLVSLGGRVQEIDGIVHRLNDVLNYQPDPQATVLPTILDQSVNKLSGRLSVNNLTFGYSRLGQPIVNNISFTLEPGRRIALVGASGSGKSTVARVVAGLYEPWRGKVLFDDQPRTELARTLLTNSIGMVDQELFLFEGTIRDNLTMWDDEVSAETILQAAKDAAIHDMIISRPDGYDAPVEEGGRNFSGGQRQRLEIARALVGNPSILILDEATSALDPLTEQTINENLRRRGCTCLVVAHRLSTVRDCDEIIVLEYGRIVERGTHEQLWKQNGAYTRLIRKETPESELVLDNLWDMVTS